MPGFKSAKNPRKLAFHLEHYLSGLGTPRLKEIRDLIGEMVAEREFLLVQAQNLLNEPLTDREKTLYSGIRSGRTRADRTKG
jgi:hypothetical protein